MQFIRKLLLKLAGKEIHSGEVNTAVAKASDRLIRFSGYSSTEVLTHLNSSLHGLPGEEARQRFVEYGNNEVVHETAPAWYHHLIQAFINPFVGILILLAIASLITEFIFTLPGERDLTAVIIISILVLISVLVACIFIPFPPMLPLHLLIQNLLYDISRYPCPGTTLTKNTWREQFGL